MYFIICIMFFIISIFLTIKLKFPQFKVLKNVFKKGNKKQFQTLFVSLASHIGTGNLVGITTGIILAGPGFLFWMWIYAFFSSVFALVENRYAVKYQELRNNECYSGSPYYIKKGFNNIKLSYVFAFFLFIFLDSNISCYTQKWEIVIYDFRHSLSFFTLDALKHHIVYFLSSIVLMVTWFDVPARPKRRTELIDLMCFL